MIVRTSLMPLQRDDSVEARRFDIFITFSANYHGLMGTEALQNSTRTLLEAAAEEYNYHLHITGDVWVAVKKDFLPKVRRRWILVIPGIRRRYASKGIIHLKGWNHQLQRKVTIGAGHYRTRSRKGHRRFLPEALRDNRRFARKIGRWAKWHGKGRNIVLFGADFNLNIKKTNVFFGQPLTVCWNELGRYPGTHGKTTIDGIASYNKDNKVSCVDAWTENANSDHDRVKAIWNILP